MIQPNDAEESDPVQRDPVVTAEEAWRTMNERIAHKEAQLRSILDEMQSAVIAFSGGVDSAYLAFVANDVLGERALAVTADSASLASWQRKEARDFAQRFGLRHEVVFTDEMSNPNYTTNPANRCFFCKDELFAKLSLLAQERGFQAIAYGVNLDDLKDFRPGQQAAQQWNIRAPLVEAELTKQEIRELSRVAGLPTWDRPASPCLSSRVAYGQVITMEKLSTIDRGEQALRDLGFREFRVRHHDRLVRIEIAKEELPRALNPNVAEQLTKIFKALGFQYVTLDLEGFRSGALNEVLHLKSKSSA